MMEFVREGDAIYIHDFSRLARSTVDLLSITARLQEKGVHLVSNKENICFLRAGSRKYKCDSIVSFESITCPYTTRNFTTIFYNRCNFV